MSTIQIRSSDTAKKTEPEFPVDTIRGYRTGTSVDVIETVKGRTYCIRCFFIWYQEML